MKKLLIITMFISVITFACKKQDPDIIFSGSGKITAIIDGQNFSADISLAFLEDSTLQLGRIDQDQATVQFHRIFATGSFTLNEAFNNGGGYIENISLKKDATTISVGEGSYTITKLTNKKVEGTFEGMGYDIMDVFLTTPIPVENGTFEADF